MTSDDLKPPKPPRSLSKEAKGIWASVVGEWSLDRAGLLVLGQALESLDRMRQAQRVLAKEGIVCADRFGQPKQHPATIVERDSRAAMLRAFRQLNLDIKAPSK
jgi:P27 family predicted phage terminase small subunit